VEKFRNKEDVRSTEIL